MQEPMSRERFRQEAFLALLGSPDGGSLNTMAQTTEAAVTTIMGPAEEPQRLADATPQHLLWSLVPERVRALIPDAARRKAEDYFNFCFDAYGMDHIVTEGETERCASMALYSIGNCADVPGVGAELRPTCRLVDNDAYSLFAWSEYHGCFAEPVLPKPEVEDHGGTGQPSVPGDNG